MRFVLPLLLLALATGALIWAFSGGLDPSGGDPRPGPLDPDAAGRRSNRGGGDLLSGRAPEAMALLTDGAGTFPDRKPSEDWRMRRVPIDREASLGGMEIAEALSKRVNVRFQDAATRAALASTRLPEPLRGEGELEVSEVEGLFRHLGFQMIERENFLIIVPSPEVEGHP